MTFDPFGDLETRGYLRNLAQETDAAIIRRLEHASLWAGQDRATTSPDIAVSGTGVLFAHPNSIRNAIEHALRLGSDPKTMRERPGDTVGLVRVLVGA